MKLNILYIIVAIFALSVTSVGAKAPRVSPVELLSVGGTKFTPTKGQIDLTVRSNVRKKLTVTVGSSILVGNDVLHVTLSEPIVVAPMAEQVVTVHFDYRAKPLEVLALVNSEKVHIKVDAKFKIGNARRARPFLYEMDATAADLRRYMKF